MAPRCEYHDRLRPLHGQTRNFPLLTLIHNAEIYTPDRFGPGCVLVGGGKILHLGTDIPVLDDCLDVETVDLCGAMLVPGFIDGHVHITGGGGEDGFATQAPTVPLSQFTRFGVTSVV